MFGHRPNILARGIKRVLGDNAVGSLEPPLSFDFTQNRYSTVGGTKSLSSALTHVRNGNATMVDGYGPELVTNGTFDSDTSGWTGTSATLSVAGSQLNVTDSGAYSSARQLLSTEVGKTYLVLFDVISIGGGGGVNIDVYNGEDYTPTAPDQTSDAYYVGNRQSFVFVAENSETTISFRGNGGSGILYKWDNISVREMPVLKWAPHNLLTYSEDFSNAAWSKTRCTITSNQAVAPDGSLTADLMTATDADARLQGTITNTEFFVTQSIWVKSATGSNISGQVDFAGLDTLAFTANGEWQQVSTTSTNLSFSDLCRVRITNSGDSLYIWGAHLYRSDLGGMVDNPDRGDSYVPTTSSAVYLPRIGHHEYNGYEWVDKGLLAESEARTNLITNSDDVRKTPVNVSFSGNVSVSPDGSVNADRMSGNGTSNSHYQYFNSTATGTNTQSVYVKYVDTQWVQLAHTSNLNQYANFDIINGVVGSAGAGVLQHTIEEVGNGWYRISAVHNVASSALWSIALVSSGTDAWLATSTLSTSVDLYGWQLEQGSVPSSYIPTSGSTVTRAAETFTVPSANLPWPTAEVIGPELVTNGTFDTDSDWTDSDLGTPTSSASISGGVISLPRTDSSNYARAYQNIAVTVGNVYKLTFDGVSSSTQIRVGNSVANAAAGAATAGAGESKSIVFTATVNPQVITLLPQVDGETATADNISVREINPLSVSIQMKGEMDYADEDNFYTVTFFRWYDTVNDYIIIGNDTDSTDTGEVNFRQFANGVQKLTNLDVYEPGLSVPFNVAMRNGSTFVGGAVDGVSATASTSVVALPDLSSTNLSLAYDYMGTISEFRIWDKDLGDSGLEEASS